MLPKKYKKVGSIPKNLITRNHAIKKLGVTLTEFRRLCIFSGVFPKNPFDKSSNSSKLYYSTKDISHLSSDPLLKMIFKHRIEHKKIRAARSRLEPYGVNSRANMAFIPSNYMSFYRLDNQIRERYPSFIDALRDIDDCLTVINLIANLPANKNTRVTNKFRNLLSFSIFLYFCNYKKFEFI